MKYLPKSHWKEQSNMKKKIKRSSLKNNSKKLNGNQKCWIEINWGIQRLWWSRSQQWQSPRKRPKILSKLFRKTILKLLMLWIKFSWKLSQLSRKSSNHLFLKNWNQTLPIKYLKNLINNSIKSNKWIHKVNKEFSKKNNSVFNKKFSKKTLLSHRLSKNQRKCWIVKLPEHKS